MASVGAQNSADFSAFQNTLLEQIMAHSGQDLTSPDFPSEGDVLMRGLAELSGVEGIDAAGIKDVRMEPSSKEADTMFIDFNAADATQMRQLATSINSMTGGKTELTVNDKYNDYGYTLKVPISEMSKMLSSVEMVMPEVLSKEEGPTMQPQGPGLDRAAPVLNNAPKL